MSAVMGKDWYCLLKRYSIKVTGHNKQLNNWPREHTYYIRLLPSVVSLVNVGETGKGLRRLHTFK